MIKKNKKAQHEIVGFVIIVLIVSIIGLILLSLTLGRGDSVKQTSAEISDLLEASMFYTTDCAISYLPQYKTGQELVKTCYNSENAKCLNEENVCDVLNSTMKEIVGKSLDIHEEGINKAYKLNIYYRDLEEEVPDEIILITEGGIFENCKSKIGASHSIASGSFGSGIINIELEVCKG